MLIGLARMGLQTGLVLPGYEGSWIIVRRPFDPLQEQTHPEQFPARTCLNWNPVQTVGGADIA